MNGGISVTGDGYTFRALKSTYSTIIVAMIYVSHANDYGLRALTVRVRESWTLRRNSLLLVSYRKKLHIHQSQTFSSFRRLLKMHYFQSAIPAPYRCPTNAPWFPSWDLLAQKTYRLVRRQIIVHGRLSFVKTACRGRESNPSYLAISRQSFGHWGKLSAIYC